MSHAAVVARELGVACVCGAEKLRIEPGEPGRTTAGSPKAT